MPAKPMPQTSNGNPLPAALILPSAIKPSAAPDIQELLATTAVAAAIPPVLATPSPVSVAASPSQSTSAPVPTVADAVPTTNQHQETTMSAAQDMMTFSQGNFEAFVKASQIWTTGLQDLGKTLAQSAREQMDQSVSGWKSLSGVKSLKEAMDIQGGMARSSMEKAVSETSKLTDASIKLAEQAIAPIAARVTLATEKFGRVPTAV